MAGEVSNLRRPSSGHLYFTLKDEAAAVRCVMFRSQACRLKFRPEDGVRVVIHGYVSVYQRDGVYQLYVQEMEPDGMGALYLSLQKLKQQLEREGLFDPARKRPLPLLPRWVGVVTSAAGAAWRDILTVSHRRYPGARLILAPVQVQGDEAPGQICRALELLQQLPEVDVIIVGRGGGSMEELWAFNDEKVARAIFGCRVPVVSAVGHETDWTLADYVADVRAPTPSAAAERVFPSQQELAARIAALRQGARAAMGRRLERAAHRLEKLLSSRAFRRPDDMLNQRRQRVDELARQAAAAVVRQLELLRMRVDGHRRALENLNPEAILARGYSICSSLSTGMILRDARAVRPGEAVRVQLHRGTLEATVRRCENAGEGDAQDE